MHAIITCNHRPFFQIFSNFVHFCPNFQIFCSFSAFLCPFSGKLHPCLSRIDPALVTRLIVMSYHGENNHLDGTNHFLSMLSRRFWVGIGQILDNIEQVETPPVLILETRKFGKSFWSYRKMA